MPSRGWLLGIALVGLSLVAPWAGAAPGAQAGSARLSALTYDGCGINDTGALVVSNGPDQPLSFHFRGVINDVHGTREFAAWDAATLLPLGFFCRAGELAEILDVREIVLDCVGGVASIVASNDFFEYLELRFSGAGCR